MTITANYEASPFWHSLAKKGLWRLYDNTLNPFVSRRYVRYGKHCRSLAPPGFPAGMQPWPFRNDAPRLVKAVLSRENAAEMSDSVTEAIKQGAIKANPSMPFHFSVPNPLDFFGDNLLDIFDGPLGDTLCDVFGSHFRLEWLDYYRTVSGAPAKSWLWHIDNDPPFVVKILLYITDANEENGATHVMSMEDSRKYFKAGYFGVFNDEREADLQEFSNRNGLSFPFSIPRRDAGDAMVFSTNLLHKGGEVRNGYRDVMSFLLLPSTRPWREMYESLGKTYVHQASGFPSDPFHSAVESA
jgi:hypothetical protein